MPFCGLLNSPREIPSRTDHKSNEEIAEKHNSKQHRQGTRNELITTAIE